MVLWSLVVDDRVKDIVGANSPSPPDEGEDVSCGFRLPTESVDVPSLAVCYNLQCMIVPYVMCVERIKQRLSREVRSLRLSVLLMSILATMPIYAML